jgi:hypothetical protein
MKAEEICVYTRRGGSFVGAPNHICLLLCMLIVGSLHLQILSWLAAACIIAQESAVDMWSVTLLC